MNRQPGGGRTPPASGAIGIINRAAHSVPEARPTNERTGRMMVTQYPQHKIHQLHISHTSAMILQRADMTDFYTPQEAAEILQVDRTTLYRWIYAGDLNAQRIGGRWRIEPDEVDRVLTKGTDEWKQAQERAEKQK